MLFALFVRVICCWPLIKATRFFSWVQGFYKVKYKHNVICNLFNNSILWYNCWPLRKATRFFSWAQRFYKVKYKHIIICDLFNNNILWYNCWSFARFILLHSLLNDSIGLTNVSYLGFGFMFLLNFTHSFSLPVTHCVSMASAIYSVWNDIPGVTANFLKPCKNCAILRLSSQPL